MPFFTTELDDVKSSATGGADPWPSDVYLNVWVCNDLRDGIGRVILGYAQFPGGPPTTDGVVIANFCFGKGGTAQTPFHLGRTATHEIRHWLDLRHIWGDDRGSCSGSDMVEDTPNQADATFNSPTFPQISCSNGPNGNMFMNCMDYTDDVAMFMFTKGQSRRMDACLEGARASFLAAPAFALTGARTGPAPAPTTAAPAVTPFPHPSTPEPAALAHAAASPTSHGDGESLRFRHEVERLRQDNHNAMLMLNGIRAALNSDSVNTTGG
ncbi:UNVERIFIED_ORG: hypothetical protein ABID57_003248 [Arthrobacter sp. UYEF1]